MKRIFMWLWPKHFEVPETPIVNYLDLSNISSSSLEILEINLETNGLAESLGVDQARFDHLNSTVDNLMNTSNSTTQVMVKLNKEFKHVNEVVLCSMITVHKADMRRRINYQLGNIEES